MMEQNDTGLNIAISLGAINERCAEIRRLSLDEKYKIQPEASNQIRDYLFRIKDNVVNITRELIEFNALLGRLKF